MWIFWGHFPARSEYSRRRMKNPQYLLYVADELPGWLCSHPVGSITGIHWTESFCERKKSLSAYPEEQWNFISGISGALMNGYNLVTAPLTFAGKYIYSGHRSQCPISVYHLDSNTGLQYPEGIVYGNYLGSLARSCDMHPTLMDET